VFAKSLKIPPRCKAQAARRPREHVNKIPGQPPQTPLHAPRSGVYQRTIFRVNYQRLISSVYMLLVAAAVVFAGYWFWQFWESRLEYTRLLQDENKTRVLLAEARQKLRDDQRTLERLRTDPAFVDTIIRRRLGYAKPGELIFRFEQSDGAPAPFPAPPAGNDR
jgi:cell division protein FtsB